MKNWEDYNIKSHETRYDLCCTSKYLVPYTEVGNNFSKIGKVTGIDFCDDGVKLKTDITNNWLFQEETMINKIKRVIFNDPCTIILWNDGTKTIVRAENEPYDPEKGLAMCLAKKALGNKGNYYNVFRKWMPKEEK